MALGITSQTAGFREERLRIDAHGAPNTMAAERKRRPLDVLVVDSDPETRRMMERALGHRGYLVLSVPSLKAARAMLNAFIVDAVICDVCLPDGIGAELMDALDALGDPPATIAMTAEPALLDAPWVRRSFDRLLRKPVNVDQLHRLLRAGCAERNRAER